MFLWHSLNFSFHGARRCHFSLVHKIWTCEFFGNFSLPTRLSNSRSLCLQTISLLFVKRPHCYCEFRVYLWGSLVLPCLIFHVIWEGRLPNHYGLKTANATYAGASSGEFSIAMEITFLSDFFFSCHSHFFALEIVWNIASPKTFSRTSSTLTVEEIQSWRNSVTSKCGYCILILYRCSHSVIVPIDESDMYVYFLYFCILSNLLSLVSGVTSLPTLNSNRRWSKDVENWFLRICFRYEKTYSFIWHPPCSSYNHFKVEEIISRLPAIY